jgi:BRCT domain type II-containing protein
MNIQPLKTESVPVPAKPKAQVAKPSPASSPTETSQSAKSQRLLEVLRNEPDVRASEVERGKALAADPNYPSDDVLAKLAEIFVKDASRIR